MSYYAKIKGDIHLNGNLSEISEILDQYPGKENGISYNAIRAGFKKQPITIGVDDYADYDEEAFTEFFNELNPYTESGEVRFTGEDNELWRFIFIDKAWTYQNGTVSFTFPNQSIPVPYEPDPRTVIAIFSVTEPEENLDTDDGPLDYFERGVSAAKNEGVSYYDGISLENAVLCDDDDDALWDQYHVYLAQWIMDNHSVDCKGASPLTYDQWLERRD